MRTVAVVLAGGSGLRLGGAVPKQLQLLAGRTLLEHSAGAFQRAPEVDEIVVVLPADFVAAGQDLLSGQFPKLSHVIAGGVDRPGSTRAAIELLSRSDADCNVLFHDAARPLVEQHIIASCVTSLQNYL